MHPLNSLISRIDVLAVLFLIKNHLLPLKKKKDGGHGLRFVMLVITKVQDHDKNHLPIKDSSLQSIAFSIFLYSPMVKILLSARGIL